MAMPEEEFVQATLGSEIYKQLLNLKQFEYILRRAYAQGELSGYDRGYEVGYNTAVEDEKDNE